MSKSSARMATQLLKLISYKTTVIHTRIATSQSSYQVNFHSCFLQSVIEGEIDLQLTFFSDEACFHLQGYINMQNNCYWSSRNPHWTHKVPLQPVKVGVWCAVSAQKIFVPVFFNKRINCERYLHVEGQHFQHILWSVNCDYFIPNTIGH
jgi:hypothetical protein